MHRRWLTGTLVVCAVALTAAACGDSDDPAPPASGGSVTSATTETGPPPVLGGSMPTSIGAGEGKLNLVVRPGYADDSWFGAFQDETGCVVTPRVAGSSDEMVQLLHTGQYDGVSAWGDAATRLVLAGDAAPVNVDLIRSYPDLSGFLKDQPDNTYQGTHYGIPQAWGANLLMWRPDVVQPDPDSWGVVFDPASPNRGEVTAADDPFSIAAAALYLKATQPDLGITDVYELTAVQFQAAVALAKVQRTLVGQYWTDPADLVRLWGIGAAVVGSAWQASANAINADATANEPVEAIVPKEGATGWSTTWMVYLEGRQPELHVPVDGLHHAPRRPGAGRDDGRRGAGQPEGLRRDRDDRSGLLRHVPRGGRGVRGAARLRQAAAGGLRRRPRRHLYVRRRLAAGVGRDYRLTGSCSVMSHRSERA